MPNPTRRAFIAATAAAACACSGCPLFAVATPERPAGPVDVGPLEDFAAAADASRVWAAAGGGFFVVRRGGRLYAVSPVCTHKSVTLVPAPKGAEGFKCPRHGSTFDAAGRVTKSPARKSLPRFAVELSKNGHLVIDPSKQFGERDWDEPGAFVDLKSATPKSPPPSPGA